MKDSLESELLFFFHFTQSFNCLDLPETPVPGTTVILLFDGHSQPRKPIAFWAHP